MKCYAVILLLLPLQTIPNVTFGNNFVTISSRLYTCTQVAIALLPTAPDVTVYGVRVAKNEPMKRIGVIKLTQQSPYALVYADWAGLGNDHYRLYCVITDTSNKTRTVAPDDVISVTPIKENSWCSLSSPEQRSNRIMHLSHTMSGSEIALTAGGALLVTGTIVGTGVAIKKGLDYISSNKQKDSSDNPLPESSIPAAPQPQLLAITGEREPSPKPPHITITENLPAGIQSTITSHPERGKHADPLLLKQLAPELRAGVRKYKIDTEPGPKKPLNATAQPTRSVLKKNSAYPDTHPQNFYPQIPTNKYPWLNQDKKRRVVIRETIQRANQDDYWRLSEN